ncbi:hypothetical protein NMD86_11495 [Edwardsiella tarda]|uniref:hypothetical protein n=1 Tax=Edwardsiella tarda TaxID=636 RepID=UPI00351C48AF
MYLDSNYVGIESVFILSVFLYLFRDCSLRGAVLISYGGVLVSLLVGVALTFSRSAYLAVTLLILMNFIFRSRILTSLSFFLVPLTFLILTYLISTEYSHDLSFESKFRILIYAYDYISSANVSSILLGVGLGNSVDVIGIGSHNLIITFLIETGVIGLLLFLIMLSWVCLPLKSDALLVVLPFFIASMSLGTTALPYFFTFSYLCILYKKNQFTIS